MRTLLPCSSRRYTGSSPSQCLNRLTRFRLDLRKPDSSVLAGCTIKIEITEPFHLRYSKFRIASFLNFPDHLLIF